jgi:2-haloacid dehalogenase
MAIRVCVFDAYGTLFDVAAAARACAAEPGREALAGVWPLLAETWRLKQLQYTWLRAVAGAHTDFWSVTQDGLDYALETHDLADAGLRDRLLQLYWELEAYPEVPAMLDGLRAQGLQTAILSNGSPEMLKGAVDHAGLDARLDAVISVQDVGVFKPHRSVYELVGKRFGADPAEVAFFSSNGWDAAAASGFGFYTTWANRAGDPVDRLPWRPDEIVKDLTGVADLIAAKNGYQNGYQNG